MRRESKLKQLRVVSCASSPIEGLDSEGAASVRVGHWKESRPSTTATDPKTSPLSPNLRRNPTQRHDKAYLIDSNTPSQNFEVGEIPRHEKDQPIHHSPNLYPRMLPTSCLNRGNSNDVYPACECSPWISPRPHLSSTSSRIYPLDPSRRRRRPYSKIYMTNAV